MANKSNQGVSVNELQHMLQFGAQKIMNMGEEVVEEDIDKLLEYSAERTEEINRELKKIEDAFNL